MTLSEWGYRLESKLPDWFTPRAALLLICGGLFILLPWWG